MAVLIYVHGFLSAPQSAKAQMTKAWFETHKPEVHFICPHLSSYPREAKQQLESALAEYNGQDISAIGSSLGGYWSTYLVERQLVKKAVLINPAVAPQTRLPEFIGKEVRSYYTEDSYMLTEQDMADFEENDFSDVALPDRYWLMVQTGDETLDYRQAVKKYAACKQTVEEGGSHTFDNYDRWLPEIARFLNL